eukprot:g2303.t1
MSGRFIREAVELHPVVQGSSDHLGGENEEDPGDPRKEEDPDDPAVQKRLRRRNRGETTNNFNKLHVDSNSTSTEQESSSKTPSRSCKHPAAHPTSRGLDDEERKRQQTLLDDAQLLEHSLGGHIQEQRYKTPYGTATFAFDGTIDDYSELCVMFGFLMLFSIALPIVSGVIYLLRAVKGVGVWLLILKVVVFVSVPTNACLLVITAQVNKQKHFFLSEMLGEKDPAAIFFLAFLLAFVRFVAMHATTSDKNFVRKTQGC